MSRTPRLALPLSVKEYCDGFAILDRNGCEIASCDFPLLDDEEHPVDARANATAIMHACNTRVLRHFPDIETAETVAHVTFAMTEALAEHHEKSLPGEYRYHLFNGFPGFCDHAAAAGLALAIAVPDAMQFSETANWIDRVDIFARSVIARAIDQQRPLSTTQLRTIARRILEAKGGAS